MGPKRKMLKGSCHLVSLDQSIIYSRLSSLRMGGLGLNQAGRALSAARLPLNFRLNVPSLSTFLDTVVQSKNMDGGKGEERPTGLPFLFFLPC